MRVHVANLAGLVAALAAGLSWALAVTPAQRKLAVLQLSEVASTEVIVVDGQRGLRDAGGHFTPIADYRRIISLSSVTDGLLLALCEPTRIAALSPYAAESPTAFRYEGFPRIDQRFDPERILQQRGDLMLAHHLSRPEHTAKLRASGLAVFDLGEMKGMQTLVPNILTVATLIGQPARGRALASRIRRQMAHIADDVERRPSGLYVGVHGDKLYGGTRGTSYADVLHAAGLEDRAAGRFSGWPAYTAEHLLQLDPEVMVTQKGMGGRLCQHPGLHRLRVCTGHGHIAELPSSLLVSPGLEMVESAELLHALVFHPATEPLR